VKEICEGGSGRPSLTGNECWCLSPINTRHAPIDILLSCLSDLLHSRVSVLDYMVAHGTHAAMEPDRLYRHIGLTSSDMRRDTRKSICSTTSTTSGMSWSRWEHWPVRGGPAHPRLFSRDIPCHHQPPTARFSSGLRATTRQLPEQATSAAWKRRRSPPIKRSSDRERLHLPTTRDSRRGEPNPQGANLPVRRRDPRAYALASQVNAMTRARTKRSTREEGVACSAPTGALKAHQSGLR